MCVCVCVLSQPQLHPISSWGHADEPFGFSEKATLHQLVPFFGETTRCLQTRVVLVGNCDLIHIYIYSNGAG